MRTRGRGTVGRWLLVPAICLLASCGPCIQYTPITDDPVAARAPDAEIRIYRFSEPRCAYEELGVVRASRGVIFGGTGTYVDGMMKKAREVGGDAILLGPVEPLPPEALEGTGLEPQDALIRKGTVIRFVDRECVD